MGRLRQTDGTPQHQLQAQCTEGQVAGVVQMDKWSKCQWHVIGGGAFKRYKKQARPGNAMRAVPSNVM
jgi:hypothetical protein